MNHEDAYKLLARLSNNAINWVEFEAYWMTIHFDHPDTGTPLLLAVQLEGQGRRVLIEEETHEELYEF